MAQVDCLDGYQVAQIHEMLCSEVLSHEIQNREIVVHSSVLSFPKQVSASQPCVPREARALSGILQQPLIVDFALDSDNEWPPAVRENLQTGINELPISPRFLLDQLIIRNPMRFSLPDIYIP